MINANFFYFIIIITLFVSAPDTCGLFPCKILPGFSLILPLLFWFHIKRRFNRVKRSLADEKLNIQDAKRLCHGMISFYSVIAVVIFICAIFLFDLKLFLKGVPVIGAWGTGLNILGVSFFIVHLSIIWFWAYRALGSSLSKAGGTWQYVFNNIKFNLVIILPWFFISLMIDILSLPGWLWLEHALATPQWQITFFALFLIFLSMLGPGVIILLWGSSTPVDMEFKEKISSLAMQQGVKFKKIIMWDIMDEDIATAAVLGIIPSFRYLLITPKLKEILNWEEMAGVVTHEIGHIKKKHLIYYLVFFLGFIVLMQPISEYFIGAVLSSDLGIRLFLSQGNQVDISLFSLLTTLPIIIVFLLYFRFVFGYFMRNFERQADLYCFETGANPLSLISAFLKLAVITGDSGQKKNWHHFNIPQRIMYIDQCIKRPSLIRKHGNRIKASFIIFVLAMIIVVAFNTKIKNLASSANLQRLTIITEKLIAKDADNYKLYNLYGFLCNESEDFNKAGKAYEKSLSLNHKQPEILNNLAWLLLTTPDESQYNPERAFLLVVEALRLMESPYILDTLAEACLALNMCEQAVDAAKRALALSTENRSYYEKQLKRMNGCKNKKDNL